MIPRTSTSRHSSPARRLAIALAIAGAALAAIAPATGAPAELNQDLHSFITAAMIRHRDQPFARWPLSIPVCMNVTGVEASERDLVVTHIYELARAVGAPVGGANCDPSFFVFVTAQPDATIAALRQRDPRLFNTRFGVTQVERFMNTPRPVRVWYNTQIGGGVANSKFRYDEMRVITQVFVFVDLKRLGDTVNFHQLADYVAMVGLAEINLDGDLGSAPTILRLFSADAGARESGLTSWDQAVLYSLYNIPRRDIMQADEMANLAARRIALSP